MDAIEYTINFPAIYIHYPVVPNFKKYNILYNTNSDYQFQQIFQITYFMVFSEI